MGIADQKLPQFALIKQFLEQQIKSGQWPPGTRIPTEQSLTETFSVSRMTARRAVKELADVGLVARTPGLGTFVTELPKPAATIAVDNVIDRAKAADSHSYRILSVDAVQATAEIAKLMGLQTDTLVFELTLIHLNNRRPVQWQQLCINRAFAPALLKQKLDKIDPNAYLQWVCPSKQTDYQVKAVMPSASQRLELALSRHDSPICMQVSRRDWIGEAVVSFSTMLHPADDYYLGTDFGQ